MTQDKALGGKDAFALFPGLMGDVAKANQPKAASAPAPSPPPERGNQAPAVALRSAVPLPPHPDNSWLTEGKYIAKAQITKDPTALILLTGEGKTEIAKAFQGSGYRIEVAASQSEAIAKVKALDFAAIVADAGFTGLPLAKSPFHLFMQWLPMQRRRAIHYTFIGPQTHTLYCLEALTESVNLVVNAGDVQHFDVILRKGLADYNALFQPYLAALAKVKKASAL